MQSKVEITSFDALVDFLVGQSKLLQRLAEAQERIAKCSELTLQAYNAANCETLKAMDAREGREIEAAKRAEEYSRLQRQLHDKQMQLIERRINERGNIIS